MNASFASAPVSTYGAWYVKCNIAKTLTGLSLADVSAIVYQSSGIIIFTVEGLGNLTIQPAVPRK